MENTSTNQYFLEKAPISKSIIHLSVPMMIGMSVGTVYSVINAFFIGLIHNTAMMTAVTLGLPIFTVLMALGNMFGVGGGTFITRLIAKNKIDEAKGVAGYTLYGSIISSIILAIVVLFIITPIIKILGADNNTFQYTKEYTLTMFLGGFTIVLNFALEQIVRGVGASKESMHGMIIAAVLNLIFDPLFILILKINVVGVALALILSSLGSSIYYLYYLQTKSEQLQGFIRYFRISLKEKIEIYKIGVSELIMAAFLIITTLLLNNFSIAYGDNVVTSFGISLRIVQVPEFLSMGLTLGIIPLIAFNFSSKNFNRLKQVFIQVFLWIALLTITFTTIVFIFRYSIINLFTNDTSVLEIGAYIIVAMLISSIFNGFTGLFTGIFQASGQGTPTLIMSINQGILYIPVIVILHNFYSIYGVIWAMTVTEIVTFVIGLILYIFYVKKNFKVHMKNSEKPCISA